MRLLILLIAFVCVSCSSMNLERKSKLSFETLFIGKVTQKTATTLVGEEKGSDRAIIGFLAGGVVGAIAASNTEGGLDQPKAFKYTVNTNGQETREIVSYSVVNIADCVEAISPDDSEIEVLQILSPGNCSNE